MPPTNDKIPTDDDSHMWAFIGGGIGFAVLVTIIIVVVVVVRKRRARYTQIQ